MLIGVGLLVLLGTVAAQAEELADVQKAFERDIRLFNGQDPTAFSAASSEPFPPTTARMRAISRSRRSPPLSGFVISLLIVHPV